jgi:type II secretory pathway predicted ATPase ExeA
MYQSFYGLDELPFELTPNPKYLFLPPRHREALSALEYGLSSAKAITVLTGEAGTGKTTLLTAAMQSDRCRGVDTVHLSNPVLTRPEFVEFLASRFGLTARAGESKAALLTELEPVLRARRDRGEIVALVIDEAQSLSVEILEEIRLLANIETPTEKLLPLVLAGQPELRDRLNEPTLRQLKQRVTLRCEIGPFTLEEMSAYISARLSAAGGNPRRLFSREAIALIHERSRGIPRLINVICDNALLTGFGLGRTLIDRATVLEVIHDFDLAAPDPETPSDAGAPRPTDRAAGSDQASAIHAIAPRRPQGERVASTTSPAKPGDQPMFAMATRTRRFSFFRAR